MAELQTQLLRVEDEEALRAEMLVAQHESDKLWHMIYRLVYNLFLCANSWSASNPAQPPQWEETR